MLIALTSKLEQRVDVLSLEASTLFDTPLTPETRRQAEHLAFQLQTTWELYVRNFVLISASGHGTDHSGIVASSLPFGYRSREAAGHYLISLYRRRPHEPDWYRPLDAIQAANMLRINNFAKFAGAIGSTPWLLDELRLTRNFFAHRSKRSALQLRALGWFASTDKISIETTMTPFVTGGIRRFDAWCASIKAVANGML